MMTSSNICPYSGLRSFTEEESLYFKGRDAQIDQITALLEQNKFLMVTGASGEGKSSLIYAGLIPNARAGFFKAKYSNWIIADFRPERSPVHNLAKALAEKFDINTSTAEVELRRGYTALLDLYLNSDYYTDEQEPQWQQLTIEEQRKKQRKGANLIILVDQFEEFFTNPENFQQDVPSQDSQIVVNLILETARIALKKQLPVYVLCTMRSDYIGQCSAFRGLPEYIGFSQFFVPRLKRKDLKQVIEEPAILSGNRISQRLIERLVYDLADGIDQLPILQHALSQIWLAASYGDEEMDLLHYAMVGGMPAEELPEQDLERFKPWFDALPANKRKYFDQPALHKVIEIHANILYETAWEKYNHRHPHQSISQQTAKKIIAITFSGLTKIDQGRAVRNRMTLDEITAIINTPGCTREVVDEIISVYREEGNSFIRPFIAPDQTYLPLPGETVLDITHESLIRNWNKLNHWASKEFEFYTTYQDLKKQLDRWKAHTYHDGYLLPIGTLTYFEKWYADCKPNNAWIKRYNEIKKDPQEAEKIAADDLDHIQKFLKQSAHKLWITKTFMKYGPARIALVAGIVIMSILSAYFWNDARLKQNHQVISKVRTEAKNLLGSQEVDNNAKSTFLLVNERYTPGTLFNYLDELAPKPALPLSIEVYKRMLAYNKNDTSLLKYQLVRRIRERIDEMSRLTTDRDFLLIEINKFTTLLTYDVYYNPSDSIKQLLSHTCNITYDLAKHFFQDHKLHKTNIAFELNYGIQQWLTFSQVSSRQVRELLISFSPFEQLTGERTFNVYYPLGNYEINGRVSNNYNGGYHTLASLYAATGEVDRVIQAFEKIKASGQNEYFIGSLFNNYTLILGILYQYGYQQNVPKLLTWLSTNYPTDVPATVYRNAVIRSGYISQFFKVNLYPAILRANRGYFFPNLTFSSRKVFRQLADDYEKIIAAQNNLSERHYLLAMNKKRRAMFEYKYHYDRNVMVGLPLETLLAEALHHFQQVSPAYLDSTVSITLPYYGDGTRTRSFKRRHIFLYPDYMEGWFSRTYHSDLFFNYLYQRKLFNQFYQTPEDFDFLHIWVAKANEQPPFFLDNTFARNYPLADSTLHHILEVTNEHPSGHSFDDNLVSLILANRLLAQNNVESGIKLARKFIENDFASSRDKYEYLEKTFFLNELRKLTSQLAQHGENSAAITLAEKFELNHEKAFAYLDMSEKLFGSQINPGAFEYLDSALSKAEHINFSIYNEGLNTNLDIRFKLILVLSRIGGRHLNALAEDYASEFIEPAIYDGTISRMMGVAGEGNFFRAYKAMPTTLTETQELIGRTILLWQACLKEELKNNRPHDQAMDNFFNHEFNYIFYVPI